MSYRPFLGAPHLQCWAEPDGICVRELDGRTHKYNCKMGISCDAQINIFHSINVAWALQIDDIFYVGRYDGTFSGFDPEGVLLRYGGWEMPRRRGIEIGQMCSLPALLDSDNMQYVYVFAKPEIYQLISRWTFPEIDVPRSYTDAWKGSKALHIYVPGGEYNVDIGVSWISPPLASWPHNYIQL